MSWAVLGAWLALDWPAFAGDFGQRGWSPGAFSEDHRSLDCCESMHALGLDLDHAPTREAALSPWRGLRAIWHTTRRHSEEAPRLRAIVSLSRPVTAAEYRELWAWAQEHCGGLLDPATSDPSRFWFVPGAINGTPVETGAIDGEPLPVDTVLAIHRENVERAPAVAPASPPPRAAAGATRTGERPGDAWARATSWAAILEPHGWTLAGKTGGQDAWCRPGKRGATSATCDGQHFYCFTSSSPPLEAQRSYDKLGLFAALEHGGDITAAARAIVAMGYGEPARPRRDRTPEEEAAARGVAQIPIARGTAGDATRTGSTVAVEPEPSTPEALLGDVEDGGDEPEQAEATPIGRAWAPLPMSALVEQPPPRRYLLRHPTRDGQACAPGSGDGLLPRGKAGILTSEGGLGKTYCLCALAIAVASGRHWLGHYHVDAEAGGGRVLLGLAEEDQAEAHRRLWEVAQACRLSHEERLACVECIVVLALAGLPVSMTRLGADRELEETAVAHELRYLLGEHAGEQGWALVVLDPLARWAGGDPESNNEAATRFVQCVESLCTVPGGPTVLVAHHTSKAARAEGRADSRGVTALTDGFRWHATLTADHSDVLFGQAKSNYSRPMTEPLRLVRDGAVLRAVTDLEQEHREDLAREREEEALDTDVRTVLQALERYPAGLPSQDAIGRAARLRLSDGRAAVREALARGLIVQAGTSRARIYRLASAMDVPTSVPTSGATPDVDVHPLLMDVPTSLGGVGGTQHTPRTGRTADGS